MSTASKNRTISLVRMRDDINQLKEATAGLTSSMTNVSASLERVERALVGDERFGQSGAVQRLGAVEQKTQALDAGQQKHEDLLVGLARTVSDLQTSAAELKRQVEEQGTTIKTTKAAFLGGWKTLTVAATIVSTVGGIVGWAISKFIAG